MPAAQLAHRDRVLDPGPDGDARFEPRFARPRKDLGLLLTKTSVSQMTVGVDHRRRSFFESPESAFQADPVSAQPSQLPVRAIASRHSSR